MFCPEAHEALSVLLLAMFPVLGGDTSQDKWCACVVFV